MAISVISVSSDSSEDSVGTPVGRVILFGTIPIIILDTTPVITLPTTQTDTKVIPTEIPIIAPTIPPSPDYTPAPPDYSPASDSEPVHMMTARKRVGPLPTHRLAVRHYVDHSSSDSSSEASSDFHSDASSDSSLRHSLPNHSSPDLPSTSTGPSRKRRRSPMTSVPASPLISGALSPVRTDLIPSPKWIRSLETATDLEGCSEDSFEPYVPREVGLGVDVKDESSEPSRSRGTDLEMDVDVVRRDEIEIDPDIQVEIDECFAYADALRDRGIDARVVVEAVDREGRETGARGLVKVRVERVTHYVMPEDTLEPAQEGAVEGHRIVGVESTVTTLTERVAELERDNRRLKDTASVKSQRVERLQRGMSRMQRELRQIRRKMPNTRSGASMTHKEVEEMVTRRVAEEMEAREATRTLEPLNENGDEQEGENG
ncbi:hypothetical protein Tco_1226137 [Tanacetum coccineum]